MDINDYLLEQKGINWNDVLSDWHWILPKEFTIWLVNRFGDLFLVLPDESVQMLDLGAGTLETLANSRDSFCTLIDQDDNDKDWLLIPLVDECIGKGLILEKNQCYSYKLAPALGGEYNIDNIEVCDISVHYSIFGQIHNQIKDVPDGTSVKFKLKD